MSAMMAETYRAPTILGIDQSLSHTALHTIECADEILSEKKNFKHPLKRLQYIRMRFTFCLSHLTPGFAYIEGYSMGSRYHREALGELGGMMRLWLLDKGWCVCVVPPKTLKKFFTGNGNADKEAMIERCRELNYHPTDDNDADAFALLQLGLAHRGLGKVTKTQRASLAKLEVWEA